MYLKLQILSSKIDIANNLYNVYKEAAMILNQSVANGQTNHADSGFDLYVPETMVFPSEQDHIRGPITLNHQVAAALYRDPEYTQPLPYYLYPRSSISKTPFRLANSVGIIDSGYRGPLIAKMDVLHQYWESDSIQYPRVLESGSRLFQICTPTLEPILGVEIVSQLDVTSRGVGGFGSTGK